MTDAFNRKNKDGYSNSYEELLNMFPPERESHLQWLSCFTSTTTGVPIELLKSYGRKDYPDYSPKSKKEKRKHREAIKKAKATVNKVAGPKVTKAKATVNKAKATPTKGTTKPSSNPKKVIKSTTKGGPVKDGVKYAQSKGDDLAGFRRGPGTKLGKDTRITKKLKKSGFTEDRLARLRKQHAAFKARRKKK